ncbi:MAG: hypothetical protein LZF61_04210 [Nitrosomonas sp.]|nr:MAG: hypothetical protein LZF61_04210 [Nitrosomonas sp.]
MQWLKLAGSARGILETLTHVPRARQPFAPLAAGLALWQAAVCLLCRRDDDLVSPDPLLTQLASLSQQFKAAVPVLVTELADILEKQLQRPAAQREPIGLLTHHCVVCEDCRTFVRNLLPHTQTFDNVRWLASQEVFPPLAASHTP